MHGPVATNEVLPLRAEETRLLVLGYGGTLRPDLNYRSDSLPSDDYAVMPPSMLALVEPLLREAVRRIQEQTEDAQRYFSGEPIPLDALLSLLTERLCGILTQVVAEFTDVPRQVADDLFPCFPFLLPLLHYSVYEWVSATVTFLRRLHCDGPRLISWLGLPVQTPIESVRGTASDVHEGGQVVLRVSWKGGRCLYYKPRLVTGEWLWHRLLETIAQFDSSLHLPASRVLTEERRFHYGWVESVEAAGHHAGTDYWHAAGATLCLAQFARLTDLHFGNILATPSGPAVTDTECLATPDFSAAAGASRGGSQMIAAAVDSLLSTGLLHQGPATEMHDVSGLFGKAGPLSGLLSGLRLPLWVAGSGGGYQLKQVPAVAVPHGNAPVETSALAVLPHLLSGYRHAAQTLLRCQDALIERRAQWRWVLEKAHAPRIVLRDTLTYGLILSKSLAAEHLRSPYKRRHFILSGLQAGTSASLPKALLRAEMDALLRLHVPRFLNPPDSRNLTNGSRRILIRHFASHSPAEAVILQMRTLSQTTLENVYIPALLLAALSQR